MHRCLSLRFLFCSNSSWSSPARSRSSRASRPHPGRGLRPRPGRGRWAVPANGARLRPPVAAVACSHPRVRVRRSPPSTLCGQAAPHSGLDANHSRDALLYLINSCEARPQAVVGRPCPRPPWKTGCAGPWGVGEAGVPGPRGADAWPGVCAGRTSRGKAEHHGTWAWPAGGCSQSPTARAGEGRDGEQRGPPPLGGAGGRGAAAEAAWKPLTRPRREPARGRAAARSV